jgi:hypothetical protein
MRVAALTVAESLAVLKRKHINTHVYTPFPIGSTEECKIKLDWPNQHGVIYMSFF